MAKKNKDAKKTTDSSGKRSKKGKPAAEGKAQKKGAKAPSAKKKAWGKDKGKNDDRDDEQNAGGARRALKPVRIKLDKEGRDAILDILHQLHVAGGENGADEDDSEDSEDSEEDSEDEGGDGRGREGESSSEEGTEEGTEEGSEDGSEPVEVDDSDGDGDVFDRQGHGDFEYDGSFGDMANLMSGLVVNETPLPGDANKNSSKKEPRASTTSSAIPSKNTEGPGEPRGASGSNDGGSVGTSSSPHVTASKKGTAGPARSKLLGGNRTSSSSSLNSKGALRSNVTREKLLASMVQEDRKVSKEEQRGKGGVSSAAIAAASTIGGGPVGGARSGYQRPDPPAAGKGNEKVRLEVCGENKKTGAPNLNGKKVRVSTGFSIPCSFRLVG